MKKTKSPDDYFNAAPMWREEIMTLRHIVLSTELREEVKWGAPCYTLGGKNIVGIGAFKSYFGLWFYQGVFLADKKNVLINAQEGTTKAMRQWRMTSPSDIDQNMIKAYLGEAIANAKAGKIVTPNRNKPLIIPRELSTALAKNKPAQSAFNKLKPGLKREYADYISQAKQAATKQRRLEKIMPMIVSGVGLNDKYRR